MDSEKVDEKCAPAWGTRWCTRCYRYILRYDQLCRDTPAKKAMDRIKITDAATRDHSQGGVSASRRGK